MDFNSELKEFGDHCDRRLRQITKKIAYDTVQTAKDYSPQPGNKPNATGRIAPNATGNYLSNNELIKVDDYQYEIVNNTSYADSVEYIGWEETPPYYVYGQTYREVNNKHQEFE